MVNKRLPTMGRALLKRAHWMKSKVLALFRIRGDTNSRLKLSMKMASSSELEVGKGIFLKKGKTVSKIPPAKRKLFYNG